MPLTKELLKQLREMEGAAIASPWRSVCGELPFKINDEETWDDDFICALRNNILPLLDEIERLQAENERLKKEIDFAYKPL
jgi:hypothetical protein